MEQLLLERQQEYRVDAAGNIEVSSGLPAEVVGNQGNRT